MSRQNPLLPIRVRKLIGTVIIMVFLVLYVFLAMTIAVNRLPDNTLAEVVYYLVAGVIWALPVGYLIRWMQRPDAET